MADYIADWTEEERDYLRAAAPISGLQTKFRNTDLLAMARDIVALSEQGLKARNRSDGAGGDETQYLGYLQQIVADGKNNAQRLLDHYENEWDGDVRQAFKKLVF